MSMAMIHKNTRKVAPHIRTNSVDVAPPCEWIVDNMLPQTVRSIEDPEMIVTLLVY